MDTETLGKFRVQLGKNIAHARHVASLKQDVLAVILHVDQPQISKWECGWKLPSLEQTVDIAIACGKRPETLIEGIVAPTREQLAARLGERENTLLYELTSLIAQRTEPAGTEPPTGPGENLP